MSKFKVGDRVRFHRTRLEGEVGKLRLDPSGRDGYFEVRFDTGGQVYSHINNFEPAPLFAVGDKVRAKKDIGRYFTEGRTYKITRRWTEDSYSMTDNEGFANHGTDYKWLNENFEHATTDEEAVRNGTMSVNEARARDDVPLYDPRRNELPWTSWVSLPTAGFTIPLDDEALPPKVSTVGAYVGKDFKIDFGPAKDRLPFIFAGGVFQQSNKPKPHPAIVALITNGQPLPSDEPKVHKNTDKATKEANRLATRYPGKEFGVFELVSKRVASVTLMEAA